MTEADPEGPPSGLPTGNSSADAVVVGSGPNGLAAAVELARHGWRVRVVEGADRPGGGLRSAELTRAGVVHDVCSSIHPLAVGSPGLRAWPLERFGLEWVHPELPLAHPLDGGRAAVLDRDVAVTAAGLGNDGAAWHRLFEPLSRRWEDLAEGVLGPLLRWPRHPFLMARFGLRGLLPARTLARRWFSDPDARALFAGLAAHSILPLQTFGTSAVALVLGAAGHAVGWPFPRGGAQRLADALVAYLRSLGGEVETGRAVTDLGSLRAAFPGARAILCDVAPRGLLAMAGDRQGASRSAARYRRRLRRFRHGPGSCKLDLLLDGPIPWAAEACRRAGTVHVGGTLEEICASEAAMAAGRPSDRPYVLVAQHASFDDRRAPAGLHPVWAYCHVPAGSDEDHSQAILGQIERFAPGFRERVVDGHVLTARGFERYNPNYVGGDIGGGVQDLPQIVARPVARPTPYRTPWPDVYLCSASTPPGGGVHGMCGIHAARAVLRDHP